MYLRMKSTHAGHALEIITDVRGAASYSFATWALTDSAPCAVSETPANPAIFSAAASCPIVTPLK